MDVLIQLLIGSTAVLGFAALGLGLFVLDAALYREGSARQTSRHGNR